MSPFITYNKRERCYLARIQRQEFRPSEYFTLKQYGTLEAALAAAENWVKDKLKEAPEPQNAKGLLTQRNSSGVVGVRLANSTRIKNGIEYPDWRWVANWPGCTKKGGTGWSVKCHGEDKAFVCAYLARKMENDDRVAVEQEYQRVLSSPEYEQILSLKRVSAE